MKIIADVIDMMEAEMDDACAYIEKAVELKSDDKELADTLATLSAEELRHHDLLHTQVKRIIETYKREKGEPPAGMMTVYQHLHKKAMERATKVRIMQEMYRAD